MITRLKSFSFRNWPLILLVVVVALWGSAATITTLPQLPTSSGGAFTQDNLNQINTNFTTANTNFTNLNNAIAGGLNGLTITTTTGTLTIPNSVTLTGPASSGTTATLAGTETLTNKTLTSPVVNSPTGLIVDCASTAACPSTARAYHAVMGIGLMATGSPSTYAVTTISPAFTSASTYSCYAQDVTTIANNIGVLTAGYVSGSAVTFTGPNTNTDTFRFTCVGY